jgi:NADPH-dependent curcumin reductase CurA
MHSQLRDVRISGCPPSTRINTPFEIGKPLEGGAVGQVVQSRADGLHEGDVVLSNLGWREYFVLGLFEGTNIGKMVVKLGA